jgi:hypothetical protein
MFGGYISETTMRPNPRWAATAVPPEHFEDAATPLGDASLASVAHCLPGSRVLVASSAAVSVGIRMSAESDEGLLSFCTAVFLTYRDYSYKRECTRRNDARSLV